MQGELARIAGAGPIPATRRRSRGLGSEAATLALVAGAAMICAVFAVQHDSPSLPEALRLVGAHGGQELTMPMLNGAGAKRSEALSSAGGDAEAASPSIASTPKPVEAVAAGAVIEPPAEVVEATPAATVVPVVASPRELPPQAEATPSAPTAAASNEVPSADVAPSPSRGVEAEQMRKPLSAVPEPPEKLGKHGKHRNLAKRPKTPQTAVITPTTAHAEAEAEASALSGDSLQFGAFRAFFRDFSNGH
jgi:hypothetical protein